ncbi:hypothetical protein ACHAPC_008052 [Botrytis cinerea]|uniref:Similar to GNAT family acetyltransferase n=2 Tax=Botryotinia fuckeliana TaxID=40559 RepID=G2XS98_BOTF4|nr:putative gnat family protein [Botrytis cinerea BcDW1]CCD43535.1 similar to GNAT family acetyltransferase [Botrytis cinerea T4]
MPSPPFILRPATLFDIPQMTHIVIAAYASSPVSDFLNPLAKQYPRDLQISTGQAVTRSYLNPRTLTLVVCSPESPDVLVAYGMYNRKGLDSGAAKFVHERSRVERLGRWLLNSFLAVLFTFYNYLRPDRATSKPNNAVFSHSIKMDQERYWSPGTFPRRQNRWHVNTIVVLPEYQGKGIGRLLMEYILERAKKEEVPSGLTASIEGERLYRNLGFKWLGDFYTRIGREHGDGGGHMIWWPEGVEKDGDY